MVKIVYFGTGEFGAHILDTLNADKNYEILAVVTQTGKPTGRGHKIEKPPVKLLAEKLGLNILQPESLKEFSPSSDSYDLNIVCQYGKIIPNSVLNIPKQGSINIHTSLLPKYRGASPIQSALMNGEMETGATIMLMDEKMDRGPILAQKKIAILPNEIYPELSERLAVISADLLLQTLPDYLSGKIKPIIQDETAVTFCKIIERDEGKIDFSLSAEDIFNRWRGLTPWPGIFTFWNGLRLKFLQLSPADISLTPGKVLVKDKKIFVGAGQKSLEVIKLQLAGGKPLTAAAFLAGHPEINGAQLG